MLIVKGFVGTELRAVPLAGDVAWLEWWTKSSARELLLGSGVGSARADCAETVAAAGVVRGNPETTPAPAAAHLANHSAGLGCPFTAFGKAAFPAQAHPTRQLSPGARRLSWW